MVKSFIRCVFCKYFLPACGSVFSFSSVLKQKYLIKFNLSVLSWIMPLMLQPKCHCQTQGHLDFFPLGVVQSCVLYLDVIYFEIIFQEYNVCLDFFFLVYEFQLLPALSLLKMLFFSIIFLCQISVDCICVGILLGSLLCFTDIVVCFTNRLHSLIRHPSKGLKSNLHPSCGFGLLQATLERS